MNGESRCDKKTIVIKGHPKDFILDTNDKHLRRPVVRPTLTDSISKCENGTIYGFERFVIITRDPFHTLWADYQLGKTSTHEHNKGILKSKFDLIDFTKHVTFNTKVLAETFDTLYVQIMKTFPQLGNDYIIIRYEDLINPITRYDQIRMILSFIPYSIDEERLDCAFALSDDPSTHRHIDDRMMTIDEAYASDELVCKIWNILLAKINVTNYGYKPWRDIKCDEVK